MIAIRAILAFLLLTATSRAGFDRSLVSIQDAVVGQQHTCALTRLGEVWCWGGNASGVLGQGQDSTVLSVSLTPLLVTLPEAAIQLAGVSNFICALGKSGKAYCWGENSALQLGRTSGNESLPTPIDGNWQFQELFANDIGVCGTTLTEGLICWGYFFESGPALPRPQKTPDGVDFAKFSYSGGFGAGVDVTGKVYAMVNSHSDEWIPVPGITESLLQVLTTPQDSCFVGKKRIDCTSELSLAYSIGLLGQVDVAWRSGRAAGKNQGGLSLQYRPPTTCVRYQDKTIHCWGANNNGILGLGISAGQMGSLPGEFAKTYQPAAYAGITEIRMGMGHACGITDLGLLKCWGDNTYGQLGTGDVNSWGAGPGETATAQSPVGF